MRDSLGACVLYICYFLPELSLINLAGGSDPKEKTKRKMLDKNCRWEDYLVYFSTPISCEYWGSKLFSI